MKKIILSMMCILLLLFLLTIPEAIFGDAAIKYTNSIYRGIVIGTFTCWITDWILED